MKVGAVIQARMTSERLPGKILKPLPYPGGDPLLIKILKQIKNCQAIDDVVVATSVRPENDVVSEICESEQVFCYRGDEDNVLSRFVDVIKSRKLDVVIRLTGDNPFVSVPHLEEIINRFEESRAEYAITKGLPLGMNLEIFQAASLLRIAERNDLAPQDLEHVTYSFRQKPDCAEIRFDYDLSDLRLTVDQPEDYAMANILTAMLENRAEPDLVTRLQKIKEEEPWVFLINKSVLQR